MNGSVQTLYTLRERLLVTFSIDAIGLSPNQPERVLKLAILGIDKPKRMGYNYGISSGQGDIKMTKYTHGQQMIKLGQFGKLDPTLETIDGRNIGQLQAECAAALDQLAARIPDALATGPKRSKATTGVATAVSRAIRRIWGSNELAVYVTNGNGQRCILYVDLTDIADAAGVMAGNMWDAAQ